MIGRELRQWRFFALAGALASMGGGCVRAPRLPALDGIRSPAGPTTLAPNAYYSWDLRAAHNGGIMMVAGDSVDVILLRHLCHDGGCYRSDTVSIHPRWIPTSPVARIRTLTRQEWPPDLAVFDPGRVAVRARVYAIGAGSFQLIAADGDHKIASTPVWVLDAPGAVRVEIDPKPDSVFRSDTVRMRATARDAAGRIVAILPVPYNGGEPADPLGYAHAWYYRDGRLFYQVRLGRWTDSVSIPVINRPRDRAPAPTLTEASLSGQIIRDAQPCSAVPAVDTTGWQRVSAGQVSALVPPRYRQVDTARYRQGGVIWADGTQSLAVVTGTWALNRVRAPMQIVPCRATFAGRDYVVQGGSAPNGFTLMAVPGDAEGRVSRALLGTADDIEGWYALWAIFAAVRP